MPRVVPVPWSEPRGALVSRDTSRWVKPLVVLSYDGERLGQRDGMYLGSLSPLFTPERHRWTQALRKETVSLASLELRNEQWWLVPVPGQRFALNGAWVTGEVPLEGAAVVDVAPEHSAPFSFALAAPPQPLELGLGPLWVPWRAGSFTFDETSAGWRGTLLPGSLGLDSLAWLRRIMRSPVERRLSSLDLHLHTPDETTDWEQFVSAHRATARLAGFEVRLHGAPARRPASTPRLTPHALLPSEGWRVVPLEFIDGLWTLRRGDVLLRWEERTGELFERLPTGAMLTEAARWHHRPIRGPKTHSTLPDDFLLLPGPSAFLSSNRKVPEGALTNELISVFADVLAAEGDAAAPLLAASTKGDRASVEALWQPYVTTAGATSHPIFEGIDCCGFFERVTVRAWSGFARDVPVLLGHPMLQRLHTLRLTGRLSLEACDLATAACGERGVTIVLDP